MSYVLRSFSFVWLLLSLPVTEAAKKNKNPLIVLATNLNNFKSGNGNNKAIDKDFESSSPSTEETENTQSPLHLQTHPLLQIPCSIQLITTDKGSRKTPLQTFVDTGAQVSVLSVEAAAGAGLLQMMDRRYEGQATGVGECRVLGRLPAGCLIFYMNGQKISKSPAITILEYTNDGVQLLLGLDFLRDHGAILNLRSEEMTLLEGEGSREISIPFIRTRANLNSGSEDENSEKDDDGLRESRRKDSAEDIDMSGM
mmetsp:Transcript_28048/g.42773  ORF Transcript_28048/g.42773 Transcript_28048/m.42773 type:complete len:255 (-) Transcript_28048:286-1050(-)